MPDRPAFSQATAWQRISLTRQDMENGELEIIRGAFRAAYLSRNGPHGMAMFGRWSDDGLAYWVYATPTTARYLLPVLQAYSASTQPPPRDRLGLDYLCGDEAGATLIVG